MSEYYHYKDKKFWRNHWWEEVHNDWDLTKEEKAEEFAFNFGFDCGYGKGLSDAKELRERNKILEEDNKSLHAHLATRARLDRQFSSKEEYDYINKFMNEEAAKQVRT